MLSAELINQLLGIAVLISQIMIAVIALAIIFRKTPVGKTVIKFISPKALFLAFLASFTGVVGSLYYSILLGYQPCELCWWQRVFMYPQAILLGAEMIKKDHHVINYCIVFSAIGALIAGYQSIMQLGFAPNLPCSASGVSCSQIFVMQFGFITIPVMALTAFLLIIVLLIAAKARRID